MNVLPRQVRAQIELARISRALDFLGGPEQLHFLAELDTIFPAHEKLRAARPGFAIDLDRFRREQERGSVALRKFRFGDYRTTNRQGNRCFAEGAGEGQPWSDGCSQAVEKQEPEPDENVKRE